MWSALGDHAMETWRFASRDVTTQNVRVISYVGPAQLPNLLPRAPGLVISVHSGKEDPRNFFLGLSRRSKHFISFLRGRRKLDSHKRHILKKYKWLAELKQSTIGRFLPHSHWHWKKKSYFHECACIIGTSSVPFVSLNFQVTFKSSCDLET